MTTTYCPTRKEVNFYGVDYKLNCIKNIIKDYYSLKESCMYTPNFELISILSDIDIAISRCGLTNRQHHILHLFACGYNIIYIGELTRTSKQNVSKIITNACQKISDYLLQGGDEEY